MSSPNEESGSESREAENPGKRNTRSGATTAPTAEQGTPRASGHWNHAPVQSPAPSPIKRTSTQGRPGVPTAAPPYLQCGASPHPHTHPTPRRLPTARSQLRHQPHQHNSHLEHQLLHLRLVIQYYSQPPGCKRHRLFLFLFIKVFYFILF